MKVTDGIELSNNEQLGRTLNVMKDALWNRSAFLFTITTNQAKIIEIRWPEFNLYLHAEGGDMYT